TNLSPLEVLRPRGPSPHTSASAKSHLSVHGQTPSVIYAPISVNDNEVTERLSLRPKASPDLPDRAPGDGCGKCLSENRTHQALPLASMNPQPYRSELDPNAQPIYGSSAELLLKLA